MAGRGVTKLKDALRMVDAFASVGATRFDLTHTDIDGQKRGFRPQQSVAQIKNSLPKLFPGATQRRNNIIVRPHGDKTHFVQLDDLDRAALGRAGDAAFLTLETSPGNHQDWVAVSGLPDPQEAKDFARRLRKGAGADAAASGATRVAGTTNYKRKYAPDFPVVTILEATAGRIVTPAALEALGLVAPPEPVRAAPVLPLRASHSPRQRHWPDYQRCLEGAPLNQDKTGPDISRADFFWAMLAIQRGWTVEETAERLGELSAKARENRGDYARLTAENAAGCVRQSRSRA